MEASTTPIPSEYPILDLVIFRRIRIDVVPPCYHEGLAATALAGADRAGKESAIYVGYDHTFGQDRKRPGEARTVAVIGITAVTMVVEISAGIAFGSMALLADGLHMASHSVALGISAFAYVYARRRARDARFSFGTGKVNALGGFAGAILLAVFSLLMAVESVARILNPVTIAFDHAIIVAVVGLLVNGVSVAILGHPHDSAGEDPKDDEPQDLHGEHSGHHHDHNLRAAYLHVLADALTSILAIGALLSGKYLNMGWLDPVMGIVGAILIARWSLGLVRTAGAVLLDRQASDSVLEAVRRGVEGSDGGRVVDLHVWSIGPGIHAAEIAIMSPDPRTAKEYKSRIPRELRVVHVTVEVHKES